MRPDHELLQAYFVVDVLEVVHQPVGLLQGGASGVLLGTPQFDLVFDTYGVLTLLLRRAYPCECGLHDCNVEIRSASCQI